MKLFSTRVHGMLDYTSVATLLTLPRALKWKRTTTAIVTGAALGTLAYSALTQYELGLARLLPMRVHLALDAVQGITLAALPFLTREDAPATATLIGFGAFELAAALLTEETPSLSALTRTFPFLGEEAA